jgi:hypothetical protein
VTKVTSWNDERIAEEQEGGQHLVDVHLPFSMRPRNTSIMLLELRDEEEEEVCEGGRDEDESLRR